MDVRVHLWFDIIKQQKKSVRTKVHYSFDICAIYTTVKTQDKKLICFNSICRHLSKTPKKFFQGERYQGKSSTQWNMDES